MQPDLVTPSKAATSRLFARWPTLSRVDIAKDEYGFIRRSFRFVSDERLVAQCCSLVVAPPWVGKSFTARAIDASLRPDNGDVEVFHKLSDLETWYSGQPLEPEWWPRWKATDEPAYWLVDALEEGEQRDVGLCKRLLERLRGLSPEERDRLHLLIFARQTDLRELAKDFESELQDIYRDDFSVVELLPLDQANARDLVAKQDPQEGAFNRVLTLISRNSLTSVAGYPAVLQHLAKQPLDANLSEADVWKGVLEQLLLEHGSYKKIKFQEEIERRFAAAVRLAVVSTLAGTDDFGEPNHGDSPLWTDAIPPNPPGLFLATRAAAREALRSGMFSATPTGHRFLHRNVREWMAAFGLKELRLEKLRPVLQGVSEENQAQPLIRPEFVDLARLLSLVHTSEKVRDWIAQVIALRPTDLFVGDLARVIPLLDGLEHLASQGGNPDWIDVPEAVNRLNVQGIEEELAARISDAEKSPEARRVFLQIGAVLKLDQVLASAATIVRDASEDDELRSWCATCLRREGKRALLRALEEFVGTADPQTGLQKAVVSKLIWAFVEKGIWNTSRAFQSLPGGPADYDVIDATAVLPTILADRMTLRDAEVIVSSLDPMEVEQLNDLAEESWQEDRLSEPPRWTVYAAAVEKLAVTPSPDAAQLRRLIPFTLTLGTYVNQYKHKLIKAIETGFRSSEAGRRALFAAAVEVEKEDRAHRHHVVRWLTRTLTVDDLQWLIGRLSNLAEDLPVVSSIALRLSEQAPDEGLRRTVETLVEEHDPGVLSRYQEELERREEWARQREKEKAREEAERRHIGEVDKKLIESPDLNLQQQLWKLSWTNFSPDELRRPNNLAGTWANVPPELQSQVLDLCATALEKIDPTPIPEGRSFPGSLQFEAQAFIALLRERPETFRLTEEKIERWLPAVVKTYQPEKWALLEDCIRVAAETTEKILLSAIDSELRQESSYSILLQDLPQTVWTENVTRWVADGVQGPYPPAGREHLLEFLSSRRPEEGRRVAKSLVSAANMREILAVDAEGMILGDPDRLRLRAIDVLLALEPDEAWALVKKATALAPRRFLENIRGLTCDPCEGLKIRWHTWPPERLADLTRLLITAYPPDNDPPFKGGLMTPEMDHRLLRSRVVGHLALSSGSMTQDEVEAVKAIHPIVREYFDSVRASHEASSLLRETALGGTGISVGDACRLLDEEDFRLIRSADDLLEVVVEELGKLEEDVEEDLPLFYIPNVNGAPQERRREKVFQTYLLRRLKDRLPGKVLDRETEVKRGRRLDIRVLAPVVVGRKLLLETEWAKTVIEVKWSDNGGEKRGVSTGLTEQLGTDYLLKEGLSHGVFLVGWNGRLGRWRGQGGPRPEASAKGLRATLQRQAHEFCSKHNGLDIRPIVWDLEP